MNTMRLMLTALLLLFAMPAAGAQDTFVSAPPFSLTNADGEELSLPRTHEGVDAYLFWASWCPYCRALMPHLQSIVDEYGERVTVFALNIRDDEDPRVNLARYGYDFVLLPEADPVMELYGVKGTPGLFLVDGCGRLRFNLYKLHREDDAELESMGHKQRAARVAPWWAAEIRQALDEILEAGDCSESASPTSGRIRD
jgi:thiol-disulfide isomerase/thioredoxin